MVKAAREVYEWRPMSNKNGMPYGGNLKETSISTDIFIDGMLVDDAFPIWNNKNKEEIIQKGTHWRGEDYVKSLIRTREWMKTKSAPLIYGTKAKKEGILKLDILDLEIQLPFVND